jgi:hypothetical protein
MRNSAIFAPSYTAANTYVTPIIMAQEIGDTRMVDLLKSKGAFLDPVLLAKRKVIKALGLMMMGPGH